MGARVRARCDGLKAPFEVGNPLLQGRENGRASERVGTHTATSSAVNYRGLLDGQQAPVATLASHPCGLACLRHCSVVMANSDGPAFAVAFPVQPAHTYSNGGSTPNTAYGALHWAQVTGTDGAGRS
jgi:hypothetical protein